MNKEHEFKEMLKKILKENFHVRTELRKRNFQDFVTVKTTAYFAGEEISKFVEEVFLN